MKSWFSRMFCATALALVATGGAQAADIRLLSFGGATNLPIWMAQEKGYFAK